MSRNARSAVVLLFAVVLVGALALPAAANHTDPNSTLTPTPEDGMPGSGGNAGGEGEWEHIVNFPSHMASDITFFTKGGKLFASQGTLGQGLSGTIYVGQRMIQLLNEAGELDIQWRADHGSAACPEPATAVTSLQHDSFATPPDDPEILTDTTDAVGRCHDTPGGGIELIDISALDDPAFEPREIHLLRFNATTHTTTLDPERPWIIFSNNSSFAGFNWLDFADIRSCLTESAGGFLADDASWDDKIEQCRPDVYRMPFDDEWTYQTVDGESDPQGPPSGCHDIVIEDNIVYCSGLNAEVLLDISDLTDENGDPRGDPLECEVVAGTNTPAQVTDCALGGQGAGADDAVAAWAAQGSPQATGWSYVGHYNHPGRANQFGTTHGNTNTFVPATEGVAVSHETRPFPRETTGDRHLILVSDERGGGVVPGGANCSEDNFDVYWHGGLHVLDVTDPGNIHYATMVDEDGNEATAVWRGEIVYPQGAFCVVHRFRFLEGEQRIVMGYYSQGIKILDYTFDDQGRIMFDEVANFLLPQANSWTADVFHTVDNPDGTRTYYIATTDTIGSEPTRGMDILSWTGEPNPVQDPPIAAPDPGDIDRVAGPGRIETAVEVSKRGFDTANTVVLAREDEYADALAGAPLAASEDAPILLTYSHRLPEATEAEIDRLGARRVILLGGEAAISADVANALTQKLILVQRIGGANRFETAALVADELPASDVAFVVEGEHVQDDRGWPDALSAAPFAAFTGEPVLLVNRDRLPDETAQALADRDVTETIVVGGAAAVSQPVFDAIDDAGHGPRRLAGADRYGTSTAVLDEALEAGMSVETTWLATGLNWPDALTAGAAAGGKGDALVLVHGRTLDNSPATRDALEAHIDDVGLVRLLGGTAALSAGVEAEVAELLGEPAPSGENGGDEEDEEDEGNGGLPFPLLGLMVLPAAALYGRRR